MAQHVTPVCYETDTEPPNGWINLNGCVNNKSDPIGFLHRKLDMLINVDTLDQTLNPLPVVGGVRFAKRDAEGTVKEASPKTDEWTRCLMKVKAARDAEQFARLFNHFAPRVKGFLMKSGASEALAEDTTQEAMALVWRKADLFDPTRASATTWIFTIVRNKQIDAIRKQRRPEPEDLPWGMDTPPDAAEVVETSQEEQRLRKAVKDLPDRQRNIIEQAYFGDLSHSEIAEVTGLPLGTIKSRIRLGLERLRHELTSK